MQSTSWKGLLPPAVSSEAVIALQVAGALRKGDKSDGNVTLVVERQLRPQAVAITDKERLQPDY